MRQEQLLDYESDGTTCPKCGREFAGRKGLSHHYTKSHNDTLASLAACDWCGEQYEESRSNLHNSDNHFCSKSCRSKAHSNLRTGKSAPAWKGKVTVECGQCGGEFEQYPSRDREYCSAECKGNAQSVWQKGAGNHQWKGGRDLYTRVRAELSDYGWQKVATNFREEHGCECEMCGTTSENPAIDVHHIVPVRCGGVNVAELLMPLCKSCHRKAESFTDKYPEFDPVLVE